jgi:crotonobetaine/carnitine-CoA ligase
MDLIGSRTLRDLLEEKRELCPQRPFLVFEGRDGQVASHTYAEFDGLVNRLANGLGKTGIGSGDRVVVHLPNGVPAVATWFALAKIGAVVVPSNMGNTPVEMEYLLGFTDAVALVAEAEAYGPLEAVVPTASRFYQIAVAGAGISPPRGTTDWRTLCDGQPDTLAPMRLATEAVLEILFTSGTTSRPKGAMITHANCLWAGERASKQIRQMPGERSLTAFPWFHANAQVNTILPTLTVGGTVVLLERYSATRFWGQVRLHGANVVSLAPIMLRTIMAQPAQSTDPEHSIRVSMYSINCTDAEKEQFERRFAVELLNGYGLTEAIGNAIRAPIDGKRRWPSVGLPTLERQVRLVDSEGHEVKQGEIGELLLKGVPGRTLMLGYYKDEQATAETLRDGWLVTGDHAWMDEAGYLYFVDRKKDIIKRAGENVSATEVELTIMEHPAVLECAIIGIPDAIRDEAVKAFVVLRPGASVTVEELLRHCEGRLARFKCPQVFELLDELPKTAIGKVDKKTLRRLGRLTGAEDRLGPGGTPRQE